MNLLYIDACPRGAGVSRSLRLADAFFSGFEAAYPQARVTRRSLPGMDLRPVDAETLARREALIDARQWDDPLFELARELACADGVVIAAPYWDLMFPAVLKVYIEHVFIREMTFCYREDQPIGLCKAGRALFLTTAGSPMGANDFGVQYLRETLGMLGIARFDSVAAEGIDIAEANAEGILAAAEKSAVAFGETFFA